MPSSWEILEMQKQRVLLSVIVPPDHRVTMAYSRSLHGAIGHLPPGSVPNQVAGLPYDAARNQAAKIALDQGMHLAFLDSDMRLQNDQAFRIMLDSGLELVTGLYHQRFPPYAPAFFDIGKNEKGELTKVEVKGWKPGDIVPAVFIPTGLWLCRHETLKRMFALHPRPFRWGVDIAPVPDYNGGTALAMCVVPGQQVLGGSPVEFVEVGEQVYTHSGRREAVTARFTKQYDGTVLRITPQVVRYPITVTPEHKLLVVPNARCPENPKLWCKSGHPHRTSRPHARLDPIWLHASDIKPGMMLCFPRMKGQHRDALGLLEFDTELPVSMGFVFERGQGSNFTQHHLPQRIPLTNELLEFFGWYASEGYVTKDDHNTVGLTLGPHEREQADGLARIAKETFGMDTHVYKGDHAWNVMFHCSVLHRLFGEWFGPDATLKRLPNWLLDLSESQTASFLRGLWAGDGYESYVGAQKRPILGFKTASEQLALQVTALLSKVGIRCEMRKYQQHRTSYSNGNIWHLVVAFDYPSLCAILERTPKPWVAHHDGSRAFFAGDYLLYPVDEVQALPYSGEVHDMTVESAHSFVLGMTICSNSEDYNFSYLAKQGLGIQPYVMTSVIGFHEVTAVVGPRWAVPYPDNDQLHGVVGVM